MNLPALAKMEIGAPNLGDALDEKLTELATLKRCRVALKHNPNATKDARIALSRRIRKQYGRVGEAFERLSLAAERHEKVGYLAGVLADLMLESRKEAPPPERTPGSGWVYFLKAEEGHLYKVGMTRNSPQKRIAHFRTKLPFEVEIAYTFYCLDAHGEEHKLHEYLAEVRLSGEWFYIEPTGMAVLRTKYVTNVGWELD